VAGARIPGPPRSGLLCVDNPTFPAPVAIVSGQIDLSNAEALSDAMMETVSNASLGLVVDVSALDYMDSAGVNMLAELDQRLRWREQRLAVVAPPGSRPREVLDLAGTDGLLSIDETREAALRRVGERSP
jgi:anti-sigma B factor antagonist